MSPDPSPSIMKRRITFFGLEPWGRTDQFLVSQPKRKPPERISGQSREPKFENHEDLQIIYLVSAAGPSLLSFQNFVPNIETLSVTPGISF